MPNIFNRSAQALGGVFLSDFAKLSFGAGNGGVAVPAVLVQNMNFTFSQQISRLYEVGSAAGGVGSPTNVYYVGGRMQGQLTIARVIGPSNAVAAFYTTFGCVCTAKQQNITLDLGQGDCLNNGNCQPGGQQDLKYILKECVITQIGVSVAAQDMLINENVQLMFNDAELVAGGAPGNAGAPIGQPGGGVAGTA